MNPKLMTKAAKAVKADKPFIYDVAAEHGQNVENVAHTLWFLTKVAERIKTDEAAASKGKELASSRCHSTCNCPVCLI